MTVMSTGQIAECHKAFVDEVFNGEGQTTALSYEDIADAASALDSYFDSNAVAINQALPLPFRTTATPDQKARLAIYVLRQRYVVGA